WSDRLQHLIAFKDACWYSWQAQIDSMKLLFTEAAFKTVLPGHGRAFYGKDLHHTRRELKRCIEWMQTFSLR
ncbi:MAG: MBL fold metallo-hydrolase, partial [Leptospiraceae bacterium]|nr:MBL fold metallo-hydrolase [Leptospiraceae bacterium]